MVAITHMTDRKIHIGIITPGFSADEEDWCIPALLDFIHYPPDGVTFSVVTLRYPDTTTPYQVYGASVTPLGFGTRAGLSRYFLYREAMGTLKSIHEKKPFDVLHGFWADEAGFITVRAGKALDIPVLVSVMGGELVRFPQIRYGHGRSFIARRMIKHALNHADGVTGGSAGLLDEVQKRVKSPNTRFWRASLGVNTDLFRPDGKSESLKGNFKILHVASLSPIKHQTLLIRAFAELVPHHKKAHLHILGDGSDKKALMALVKELGIKKSVTFHGAVAHHDLPRYYQAADVCAITSYHESQSMVALEAAGCGVVTVGTAVGILPELVASKWLIAPPPPPELGDYVALGRVFKRLADDEIDCVSISAIARATVMQEFSLSASREVWGGIYNDLLHPPPYE